MRVAFWMVPFDGKRWCLLGIGQARYCVVLVGWPGAHRNGDPPALCLALMDTGWMGPGPSGTLWLLWIVVIVLSPIGGSLVIMLILIGIKGGECDDDPLA